MSLVLLVYVRICWSKEFVLSRFGALRHSDYPQVASDPGTEIFLLQSSIGFLNSGRAIFDFWVGTPSMCACLAYMPMCMCICSGMCACADCCNSACMQPLSGYVSECVCVCVCVCGSLIISKVVTLHCYNIGHCCCQESTSFGALA